MARYESTLKAAFMVECRRLEPLVLALRHEDVRTGGQPDISFNARGLTTWLEAKHDDTPSRGHLLPGRLFTGLQAITCTMLAERSRCVIMVWRGDPVSRTCVYQPDARLLIGRLLVEWPGAAQAELARWLLREHVLASRSRGI